MVKIMNTMGYDVTAPGRWEFIHDSIVEDGPVFAESLIDHIRASSPLKPVTERRMQARGSTGRDS